MLLVTARGNTRSSGNYPRALKSKNSIPRPEMPVRRVFPKIWISTPTILKRWPKRRQQKDIDLVVVGPEVPLAEGIVDHFESLGIPIFGASKLAAEIESSKVFSKALMQKYNIPCAKSVSFSDYAQAKEYVQKQKPPIVIKADGLAAGKGVVVAATIDEALEALTDFMQAKKLGAAANQVLVEEFLPGREMSIFAFSDGTNVLPMVSACDYKRVNDGDRGRIPAAWAVTARRFLIVRRCRNRPWKR